MKMTNKGKLTVISGPMYAGKTSALLQKILWDNHCGNSVIVLKPEIDKRYSEDKIQTHNHLSYECVNMKSWTQINTDLDLQIYNSVYLDEVQFMDTTDTVANTVRLLSMGVNVIAAGLNQDSLGRPFETTALLMALSDDIQLISSICNVCGRPATRTQRLVDDGDRVIVGSHGVYEPRCDEHWHPK
jgi:thymidine kinase